MTITLPLIIALAVAFALGFAAAVLFTASPPRGTRSSQEPWWHSAEQSKRNKREDKQK